MTRARLDGPFAVAAGDSAHGDMLARRRTFGDREAA